MDYATDDLFAILEQLINLRVTRVLAVVLITFLLQLISRTVIRYVVRHVVKSSRHTSKSDDKKRQKTLIGIFQTASSVILWGIATIVILGMFMNVATLLTSAGLIGVVIGFGAQSLIRDFLAGIFIILENQYRVGDTVTLRFVGNEVTGVVEDLTVRITRLRDLEGNLHILPNGVPTVVTNQTFGFAQAAIEFAVDYDADIDTVQELVNQIGRDLQEDEMWAKSIINPITFERISGFGDKTVNIVARGKVAPAKQWDVAGEFRRRLLAACKAANISMVHAQS